MMHFQAYGTGLTIAGLTLDVFGVVLLFFFGLLPISLKVASCSAGKLPAVSVEVTSGWSVATRFGYYDWALSDLPPLALTFRMD